MIKAGITLSAVLALTVTSLSDVRAADPMVYVSGFNNSGTAIFGAFDLTTGALTTYASPTVDFVGMGWASDGNLYGLEYSGPGAGLYRIVANDTNHTVSTTLVANTSFNTANGNVGFGAAADGTLYGYVAPSSSIQASQRRLYSVNAQTGVRTAIGNAGDFGFGADGQIAGSSGNYLYVAQGDVGTGLLQVDRTTGVGQVLNSNPGYGTDYALAFSSGSLYGFSFTTADVFMINTSTGAGTDTSVPFSGNILSAASIISPVSAAAPEPGTLLLITPPAFTLLFAMGRKQMRRRRI